MSWGVGDWISNLFTSSPSAADTATSQALQGMGGQFGPETAAQYQGAGGVMPSATGAGGQDLAKTLQGLGGSLSKLGAGASGAPAGPRVSNVPGATVGRPGAPVNLGTLLQMLMAKQNQYFPGAAQTQPVTMTRPTGLLGM